MKILMITNTYFPVIGGIEQSIRSFSNEFRKMGHDVLIAAPAWKGKAEDEQYVVRMPAIKEFYNTEFSVNLPIPGFFSKVMKDFRPDVIHAHHPFFMGDFALRLSRQYRLPMVYTHHIMFDHYVRYMPLLQNQRAKKFVTQIAIGYANLSRVVVAPTDSVRNVLIKNGVTASIEVIPTGIDLERFANGDGMCFRRKMGIPEEAVVAGYAGRIVPEKNMEFWARAMMEWLKSDSRGHVLLVGQGSSEEMVKEMFRKSGCESRLHCSGFLHKQDLADAYAAMDIFAFASVSETQGVVLAEAMAAGVPVVALEAAGSRDVIREGINGHLISTEDVRLFSEAVSRVANLSPDKRNRLRHQTRTSVEDFSIGLCSRRMLMIYERLHSEVFLQSEKNDSALVALKERILAEWDILSIMMDAITGSIMFEKPFLQTLSKKKKAGIRLPIIRIPRKIRLTKKQKAQKSKSKEHS